MYHQYIYIYIYIYINTSYTTEIMVILPPQQKGRDQQAGGICYNTYTKLRFQVLTAMSMKMAVFYDVVPCSLVDMD
jgi:hypothetical protein